MSAELHLPSLVNIPAFYIYLDISNMPNQNKTPKQFLMCPKGYSTLVRVSANRETSLNVP